MGEHSGRLDSWKAIAAYLGRDVRTVMRWAKSQGLPVRRVAGGKGRSVFAFSSEIDAWLAGQADPPHAAAPVAAPVRSDTPTIPFSGARRRARHWAVAVASVGLLIPAAIVFRESLAARSPSRAFFSDHALVAVDGRGVERVLHGFDPSTQTIPTPQPPALADMDVDGHVEIVAGVASYVDNRRRHAEGGELLSLSRAGDTRWRFAFDDRLAFPDTTFGGPWILTDWQIEPASGPARVVVAAHDLTWWPSVLAVLNPEGKRIGSFANPGWIESLLWLDPGRVALAGFNNDQDAGMVAIIDPLDPADGAPAKAPSSFACLSCPSGPPLYYAVLPRSELNRVTGSRFNRAMVARRPNGLAVTTIEVPDDDLLATAIYDFDENNILKAARYDDVYWDLHRRLELEGRLSHARDACPEREGPAAIHVWASGAWQRIPVPR